jgi:DNA processing protein
LDDDYPQRLKHHNDCPLVLYHKGNASLNSERIIAIVGTRKPTQHGIAICEELIAGFLPYNVLVISGLAYGIDITAHRKCLELDIPTLGVMGNGLGRIYPHIHRQVAEKMVEKGGILSEYTHAVGPDREHFPARNRIIVGMCDGLIVVETAEQGGSMISAYKALSYHKDVFAVPGRPKDLFSSGCNLLIKTNQAMLIEKASEVAEAMNWDMSDKPKAIQKSLFLELSDEEQALVNLLKDREPVHIDLLTYEAKLTPSTMAAFLLDLEFKGVVKTLPGKRYMLL